jgi:hypothetical protein
MRARTIQKEMEIQERKETKNMEKWVENKKKIVIIPVKWQSDMPLRLYNCKEFVKSLFHGMNQIGQFSM